MDRWVGKVAIITGASQGIGAAITEKLLDLGVTVVGSARSEDKLLALAQKYKEKKGKFYPLKVDVSKEEDILKLFENVKKNIGPIYILVNNAGSFVKNGLIDGTTQDWRDVLDTNILGLCVATREAIKDMRANNVDGHIIHIGSIINNGPESNIYDASKQAVNTLTETLRQELNSIKSKIKISVVNPGVVRIPHLDSGEAYQHLSPKLLNYYKNSPKLDTADMADAIAYILSTPPHVQVYEMTIIPVGEFI